MESEIIFDTREIDLHRRYRIVLELGWNFVVWAECGAYYIPNTPMKPDFKDKRRISLDVFDRLLSDAERALRKPVNVETSYVAQPAERNSPVFGVRVA